MIKRVDMLRKKWTRRELLINVSQLSGTCQKSLLLDTRIVNRSNLALIGQPIKWNRSRLPSIGLRVFVNRCSGLRLLPCWDCFRLTAHTLSRPCNPSTRYSGLKSFSCWDCHAGFVVLRLCFENCWTESPTTYYIVICWI